MAHQFTTYEDCIEMMTALNAQGWVGQWFPIVVFGKVYAKAWRGAGYRKITTRELQSIGAI